MCAMYVPVLYILCSLRILPAAASGPRLLHGAWPIFDNDATPLAIQTETLTGTVLYYIVFGYV